MASKLLPAMTSEEVDRVIDEHYVAESQALTGQAEANLLKLGEIRGTLTSEQRQRWADILTVFRRRQRLGGDDRDPATRVVAAIEQVAEALSTPPVRTRPPQVLEPSPDLTPDEDPVPPEDPRDG